MFKILTVVAVLLLAMPSSIHCLERGDRPEPAVGELDTSGNITNTSVYSYGPCQGNATAFDAGYGNCASYSPGYRSSLFLSNYLWCNDEYDTKQGLYASEACSECGSCDVEYRNTTVTQFRFGCIDAPCSEVGTEANELAACEEALNFTALRGSWVQDGTAEAYISQFSCAMVCTPGCASDNVDRARREELKSTVDILVVGPPDDINAIWDSATKGKGGKGAGFEDGSPVAGSAITVPGLGTSDTPETKELLVDPTVPILDWDEVEDLFEAEAKQDFSTECAKVCSETQVRGYRKIKVP